MDHEHDDHPPSHNQPQAPARGRRASPWLIAAALGAVLAPLATAGSTYASWRFAEDARIAASAATAGLQSDLQALTREVNATEAAVWVDPKNTRHDCRAFNDRFDCTVTNLEDEAVTTCLTGHLAQKDGGGSMASNPLCVGRLRPRETRQVSVPWRRGNAIDICNSPGRFSGRELDWDKCDFTSKPLFAEPGAGATVPAAIKTPAAAP